MDRTKAYAVCLIAAGLAGCARQPAVRIASKNFTEQVILGEIMAQLVERETAYPVDRKLNLGGTLLAHRALVKGEIDVYPEYTGTALTAVLKQPPDSDPRRVWTTVAETYQSQWNIHWGKPLGFNNTFAIAIRGEDARRDGLKTLSQAARRRQPWKLGAGYEFEQRPDGLAALQKTYALTLAGTPMALDLGLLFKAIEQKQVDMIAANSTDGLFQSMDLQVLEDDKKCFPPYEAAILIRAEAVQGFDGVSRTLAKMEGKINEETMRRLNHEVDGKHRQVAQVAAEWLDATFGKKN